MPDNTVQCSAAVHFLLACQAVAAAVLPVAMPEGVDSKSLLQTPTDFQSCRVPSPGFELQQ